MRHALVIGALAGLLGGLLPAAATDEAESLDFASGRGAFVGDLATRSWEAAIPDGLRVAPTETQHFLVQFAGPIVPEWRRHLENIAGGPLEYIPHFTFLARLSSRAYEQLDGRPEIRTIQPYHPALKLSPRLERDGTIEATALAYRDAKAIEVTSQASGVGATVLSSSTTSTDHVLRLRVDASRLPELARLEEVSWIEPSLGEVGLDNAVASATIQSGSLDTWSIHEHGVDGSTQTATLCDTGVNTELFTGTDLSLSQPVFSMTHRMHDDEESLGLIQYNAFWSPAPVPFEAHRKVVAYYSPQENGNQGDWDDDHGHGTQMAATLAGDAPPYGVRNGNDGVAPAARLVVCDAYEPLHFHFLDDYANYWQPAYELGARVSSNSWGSNNLTNAYTIPARQQDAFVQAHRDFVLVRSMGNTGPDGLPRPEAMSKSLVAVGATLNDGIASSMSLSSSAGPAADGRVKPDVVAPGKCLMTADLPDATAEICSSGTSPATALVAGAAVLIRDYFAKGFYPSGLPSGADAFGPTSALVRALLVGSGSEIAGDREESGFPNSVQGWGRPLLDDALYFDGDVPRLTVWDEDAGLQTGDGVAFPVHVEGNVRFVLAWTDPVGAPGASDALVNDLDLTVKGPRGLRLVGNDFDGSSSRRPAMHDRHNVIEIVDLESAPPGEYFVEVRGHNVPAGPQPFALVVISGND